jgi:succinate dehydrogenase / fumarate reductase membrane anchor subunit
MSTTRTVKIPVNFDAIAWKWMRYSAILLIPLAWGHMILQDVIVGVHKIDLDYVYMRWASLGWRAYDFFLLAFAFAHGMNGLRQVLVDYLKTDGQRKAASWILLIIWLVITLMGAIAIIALPMYQPK